MQTMVQTHQAKLDRTFSVAPMMECTDRHDRYLMRLMSKHALLYTEMVVTGALLYGDADRFLRHHIDEHPVALQLGGCVPEEMAASAKLAEQAGYCEVNINVGCPSDRVQSGRFGACLMQEPQLVADCVRAMREAVAVPVTVKCRTGIDDQDSFDFLLGFVDTVREAGCDVFIVHARKAWLNGLSPKQNREIPPLDYTRVSRLKEHFPDIDFILNGGIETLDQVSEHLPDVDGVMIGRAAYSNPFMLSEVDSRLFNDPEPQSSRQEIVARYCEYIETELAQGTFLKHMSRHLLGMYQGLPGARAWRRTLSELGPRKDAGLEVIDQALAHVSVPGARVASL